MKQILRLILVALMLTFVSCEDQITTTCEDGQLPENLAVTFSHVQHYVFDSYCVSCHSGAAAQGGLDLSAGQSYMNLIDRVASSSGAKRVVPGDRDNSYLMKRLTGSDGFSTMPPAGKIDQRFIDLVGNWIDQGAEKN